jgi:nucleotide-binding universal stress UspA family protein
MTIMRTLLVATDLSAPSRLAAMRAALLARTAGAHLELLHVVEVSALEQLRHLLGNQVAPVAERLLNEAREELAQLAAEINAQLGVSPGVHLATGRVVLEITTQADALDADLVVLGSRGAGFMRHLLLGTTAERVLRKTLRPLLLVRQVPYERYQRVLVPVDFSPWTQQAIRIARAVAPDAEIILFHAFEVPFEVKLRFAGVAEDKILRYRAAAEREARENLRRAAQDAGLKEGEARLLTIHGEASARILEQEEEQDVDLIVMGKHGTGITEELLLGSVTKHILAEARCDVLVAQR